MEDKATCSFFLESMDKFAPLFVDGRIDCICGFVLLFIICQRAWSLTRGALELMVVFPRSSEKYLGKIIVIEEKFLLVLFLA